MNSREQYKLIEENIDAIHKKASKVYQYLQEARNNMEQLLIKDKQLEKAFKKEYSEQSTTVQETVLKIYR